MHVFVQGHYSHYYDGVLDLQPRQLSLELMGHDLHAREHHVEPPIYPRKPVNSNPRNVIAVFREQASCKGAENSMMGVAQLVSGIRIVCISVY